MTLFTQLGTLPYLSLRPQVAKHHGATEARGPVLDDGELLAVVSKGEGARRNEQFRPFAWDLQVGHRVSPRMRRAVRIGDVGSDQPGPRQQCIPQASVVGDEPSTFIGRRCGVHCRRQCSDVLDQLVSRNPVAIGPSPYACIDGET